MPVEANKIQKDLEIVDKKYGWKSLLSLDKRRRKRQVLPRLQPKSPESKDNLGFIVTPFLEKPFFNFVYRRTVSHLLLGTVLSMPHRLSSSGELASIKA